MKPSWDRLFGTGSQGAWDPGEDERRRAGAIRQGLLPGTMFTTVVSNKVTVSGGVWLADEPNGEERQVNSRLGMILALDITSDTIFDWAYVVVNDGLASLGWLRTNVMRPA